MSRKVVITGLGVVSPVGNSTDKYWNALLEGKSGVDIIQKFDISDYPAKIAGEIKDFDITEYVEKKEARRMDLSEQYAIAASEQAVKDANINLESLDLDMCGVVIGSGIGGINTFEQQHGTLLKSGPGRVSPFFIPMMIIDMCAGLVSIRLGFRGPNYATVSACASSSHAILDAYHIIHRGEADLMLTGGAEATIVPSSLAGFCQAKALSTRNDEPTRASRPFDIDRDGFVMGEGSGMMVMESEEHAKARGAKIYAEFSGAGMTADAYHMTAPHPEGYGAKNAMRNAIKSSGLQPEDIDYVNTHGTSTGLGDIAETKAIKAILGDRAYQIPINSTKSMIGHLLGAAGSLELIASIKSLETQTVHPTINLENPDPECDLDYVPEGKREVKLDHVMSNSFGFGGHNVSLVVSKYNGN
ncbi:MAG: beta-ketoacyl-[acyl-carrier-protein] synthase II [Calditrichaeota bacterium]|nr:MAG: beta-ketoacyl-[acyl-carrier-protein] synthase II [Calditrichota bacterium]